MMEEQNMGLNRNQWPGLEGDVGYVPGLITVPDDEAGAPLFQINVQARTVTLFKQNGEHLVISQGDRFCCTDQDYVWLELVDVYPVVSAKDSDLREVVVSHSRLARYYRQDRLDHLRAEEWQRLSPTQVIVIGGLGLAALALSGLVSSTVILGGGAIVACLALLGSRRS